MKRWDLRVQLSILASPLSCQRRIFLGPASTGNPDPLAKSIHSPGENFTSELRNIARAVAPGTRTAGPCVRARVSFGRFHLDYGHIGVEG